jgi:hypothetical protein
MPPGTTVTDDVIRVTAHMLTGSVPLHNVFYYKCDFSAPQTDDDVMQAAALQVDTMFAHIVAKLSQYIYFIDIAGFNVTQDRPMVSRGWPTLTVGGDVASQVMANGVCGLILADTGYSRSRPKKFISGFTEANISGNSLASGTIVDLGDFMVDWLNDVVVSATNTLHTGTWSKKYAMWRPIVSCLVKSAIAYQRRRKP